MKKLAMLLLGIVVSMPAFAIKTGGFDSEPELSDDNATRETFCEDNSCRVYFVNDHADLSSDMQTALKKAIKYDPNCSTYHILGFTDRTATNDYNVELAKQRVEYVAKQLGIPEGKYTKHIAGEDDMASYGKPDGEKGYSWRSVWVITIPICETCDLSVVNKCSSEPKCSKFKDRFTALANMCKDGKTQMLNDVTQSYAALNGALASELLADGCCGPEMQNILMNISINMQTSVNIQQATRDIEEIIAGLGEGSVWRTLDGKFNTSRLVSDSVAGVVLGTAGGLITSSIIKKNQIKGGFEDLSCTVGGQTVAGWGDEFTVGWQ